MVESPPMDKHIESLNDYIQIFEDVIPFKLCDDIINEYQENEWEPSHIAKDVVDKNIRNTDSIPISLPEVISKNPDKRQSMDKEIFEIVAKSISEYAKIFSNCYIEEDSGYDLLRYKEGGFYTEHTDSFKSRPRSISCSLILNDDYEGGEFAFFNKKLVYKLKKGSVIMFPSNFMFPHQIMPVTKGIRYSIVTWFI